MTHVGWGGLACAGRMVAAVNNLMARVINSFWLANLSGKNALHVLHPSAVENNMRSFGQP